MKVPERLKAFIARYPSSLLYTLTSILVLSIILVSYAIIISSRHEDTAELRLAHEPIITVLCYHHVDSRYPTPYSISSAKFTAQLDALEKAGFSFISLKQLEDFYYKDTPIPLRSAVITFDDGNLNVYTTAYPLLKKRGIPFALFIYPGITTRGHRRYCASWGEVKEMADNGVIIGCHTLTHPFLTLPPKEVTTSTQYDAWLDREIVFSKERIEFHLGRKVRYFATPFGALDTSAYKKIKQAGYRLAFNVHGMNNNNLTNPFNINRLVVLGYMSPQALTSFALTRPINFEMLYPPDLARTTNSRPRVRMRLLNSEQYVPNSVDIKMSSFKGIRLTHQKDIDTYEETLELQKQHFYLGTVRAKDLQGNERAGTWLFLFNKIVPPFVATENITR